MLNEWLDIWKVREQIIKMLRKRGYTLNTSCQPMTLEEFKLAYPNALTDRNTLKMVVQKDEVLAIHFFDENKLGLKVLKQTLDNYENQKIHKLILILKESMSPACKRLLENTEVFYESQLKYDITAHHLVNEHIILSSSEVQEVLNSHKCKAQHLPQIPAHDPIAKYIGAKKGDVVKILRKSYTTTTSISYRLVI